MRWTVERTKGDFETVLATYASVDRGVLFFHNNRDLFRVTDSLVIAFARGQWETFFPDD